jgi:hypothetical protein
MAIGDVEVVHTDTGWIIRLHGTYATQADAWVVAAAVGRQLGRETFLRSLLGRWRKRDSHGSDPHPPPG